MVEGSLESNVQEGFEANGYAKIFSNFHSHSLAIRAYFVVGNPLEIFRLIV